MFKVLNRVEGILKGFGHILLYILCARSRIDGDYHQSVGINIRKEVDWQFYQGEKSENYDRHEAKRGHNRAFHRRSI